MTVLPAPEPAAPASPAALPPVRRLTVLYDERCGFCRWARRWLDGQRQLVPLAFVPAGSDAARRRFPQLAHDRTLLEVTAVGDAGQTFIGDRAWIACMWALADYRELALRLASPKLLPFARSAISVVSHFQTTSGSYGDACEPARR